MSSVIERKINENDNKNVVPLGSDKLVFPDFNKIKVSTKTFIVMTNLVLNIDKMFNFLPVTEYILIPKRRGRKKERAY